MIKEYHFVISRAESQLHSKLMRTRGSPSRDPPRLSHRVYFSKVLCARRAPDVCQKGQVVIFSLSFLCVLGVTCWGVVIPETASATLHSGMGSDRIIKWVRRLLKITCTCYGWDIRHWSLLSHL